MTLAPETGKRSRVGARGRTLAGEGDPGSGLLSLPAKGTCLFPQDSSFHLTQTTEQQ